MTNATICPFCHKQNCKLELARRARSLTLESASTVDDLSPEQVRLAGQLEALYMSDAGLPTLFTHRDMVAPLALETDPVNDSFITSESPYETLGGLQAPSESHWFSLEERESRLSNGLIRPDSVPDESAEQLRQLFLANDAPKSQSRISLEQLRALGWLSEQDNEPVAIDPSRITKGGLLEPL